MDSPYRVLDFDHIQVQIQVAPLTAENLAAHLRSETARMKRDVDTRRIDGVVQKAVLINDASCDLLPSPAARRVQAEWIKENEHLLKLVCHAAGFVLPSTALRTTMTGVFWVAPMPFTITTHETLEHALDWAITEVDQLGYDVHPELLGQGVMAIERRRAAAEQQLSASRARSSR